MTYNCAGWTDSEQPLVSVVVPIYNHEEFLYECLNSVHSQDYDNIELIVIDDSSTDGSFAFASKLLRTPYGQRFNRVYVSRNAKNRGAHATINEGISKAKGELITVINSDDQFLPGRITSIVNAMREKRSDVGFSLVDVVDEGNGTFTAEDLAPFAHFKIRQLLNINRDITTGFGLLRQNLAVSTGNIVFSKNIYDEIGGFLPLKYCHDWDFVLQSLFYCEPAVVLQPLYSYRLHPQNSFKGLSHMAEVETEVVMRRFFRRVIDREPLNSLCPSPSKWPGYFETFVGQKGMSRFYDREMGRGLKSWRIYDRDVA
ncbi:glycosyltransferase [Sphingobium soli]|uniref:Glycosyltransferase n=1 Tax=Sphingobium soli TaxID=1591116 RepID=A0ABS8HBK4_9SPHN|nr:glycosyltransferase family 2 protein [Sphingobium soli]MCC4234468.1 glycosyltransferase [Sphingobium soli]